MDFKGRMPFDNASNLAIAGDASGKGPFSATIACSEGGDLKVKIDDGEISQIPCDSRTHQISGIQKIALPGGVKFHLSSDKKEGVWQINLLGERP